MTPAAPKIKTNHMYIEETVEKFSTLPEKSEISPRLYIPENMVDNNLLKDAGINPLVFDKYKFFLHVLYQRRVLNRNKSRREHVELNYKVFESYVGKKLAAPIIDFWVEKGVVETPGSYQPGVRSKAYRFTDNYQNITARNIGFLEEKFERKVLNLKRKALVGTIDMSRPQNAFLVYNVQELKIDLKRAQLTINERMYAAGEAGDLEAKAKANLDTIAAQAIYDGDYRWHRDAKGNRFHSNFTNFAKYLRQYAYIVTGEVLVNLDVSNSQPLFLCVLLKQHVAHMEQDMLNYIQDCEKGRLYETMMVAMGLDPKDKPARDRMKKRLFLAVFYGKNEAAKTYDEWVKFSELYSSVAAFITKAKATDYKVLSHRMQQAEAHLILDTVIKTIAENHRPEDFFATTIHDSVVTTESNAAYVMALMTHAFAELGLRVNINCEPLNK